MTKFSITNFTREEFEKYKKMHENERTKVYEVIIDFDLKHEGFFTLLTVALSGDTAVDDIIKKCKNKEEVTYEILGGEGKFSIHFDNIKLENKTFCFKQLIKGVFKKFEFNKDNELYKIKFEGELLSAALEYTKEKEKQNNEFSN